MKKYIAFILLLSIVTLVGCKENFLERAPETAISDAEFWKSTSDLQLYANNFYNAFPSTISTFGTIGIYGNDADEGSDNMINMGYNTTLNGERIVPASGGGWAYSNWSTLRNINYFLVNQSKVNVNWDLKKAYVGEALFFRAWFYYDKLRQFGDLPWITKPLDPSSPELSATRLTRNVIVDSLMNDLDKAVAYLPTKSNAQVSRINKEVALLFQARIALFEGTWEKYHAGTAFGVTGSNGEKYLKKAAEVAETLLNNGGGYGLVDTPGADGYWKLFNQTDYSSNREIMLWRKYDLNLNGGHYWHRYTNTGAGRGLTKDLIDAYLCTDGKPISVSPLYKGDATILEAVTNRDPRLSQTVYVPDGAHIITNNRPNGAAPVMFQAPSFSAANENKPATGYQVYKGHNPDYTQQQDRGTTGYILFRYAEALLIFAEAKAELGIFTQADADKSVNLLRKRVGMPTLQIAAINTDLKAEFPSLSPLINEIRRERRVELACEGYRHDDLYRWAAADEKLVGLKPKGAKLAQWTGVVAANLLASYPTDANGYIELYQKIGGMSTGYKFNINRDYLAPLATEQMLLNSQIKQNPGW